jgi:hypothetical protein
MLPFVLAMVAASFPKITPLDAAAIPKAFKKTGCLAEKMP